MSERGTGTDGKWMELKIYNQDERMTVAQILIKNGYDVGQHKKRRTETGKTLDYFLHVRMDEGNADTSK